MALLIFLMILAVPVIEIYLMIQVGSAIGALATLGLLVLGAVIGVVIVKREGLGLWRRLQDQIRAGHDPSNDLVDGLLILVAGVLLVLPGFLSDGVALLLLVPPLRHALRSTVTKRLQTRFAAVVTRTSGTPGAAFGTSAVYDTRVVEDLGDVTPPQWRQPDGPGNTGNELRP